MYLVYYIPTYLNVLGRILKISSSFLFVVVIIRREGSSMGNASNNFGISSMASPSIPNDATK